MTLWFYVKTNDDPKIVGDIVCAFNYTEGKHPEDKYSWIMQLGRDESGYWEIKGKYAALKDLTEIGIVYRIGDTVVLAMIDDGLAPDFLDPLITKYGFDNVKWIVVPAGK
ncbi:MAG: hypothetical protein ACQCN6_07850 [Candidatus Bathyarchaeia archaeon]